VHETSSETQTAITIRDLIQGTPAFIAPEQALGGADVDARADIYSTGCVAYWLLTGQLVFTADTAMKTCLRTRIQCRNHPRREPRLRFHRAWMPLCCVASPKTANVGHSLPAISFSGSTRLHSSNLGPTRAPGSGGTRISHGSGCPTTRTAAPSLDRAALHGELGDKPTNVAARTIGATARGPLEVSRSPARAIRPEISPAQYDTCVSSSVNSDESLTGSVMRGELADAPVVKSVPSS
jgi:serine/threonine protein kinase